MPNTTCSGTVLFCLDPAIHANEVPYISSLSDADAAHFNITAAEKANFMEEVTTELSVYLGMLYHMVEVFKGHDDFADELSWYIGIFSSGGILISVSHVQ